MMGFAIGAALMVGATLLLLLLPFRRRPASADFWLRRNSGDPSSTRQPSYAEFSRQQLNNAIYRDQLAELERDRITGALSDSDYRLACDELQRRLLEDSNSETGQTAATTAAPSRAVPTALGLALPLGAVLLYLMLGNPAALNPPPPQQRFSTDDIERMVNGLAAKLENEPDNLQGWAMLARSYKAMGRIPEAVRAYERAGKLLDTNAELLIDYADALAASGGGFTDKVMTLIDRALQLDPANPQALWLRGTAAHEAGQHAKAIADWEALLKLLPPESEDAKLIKANIAMAREKK